jgi:RHS repeat-associated protein
VTVPNVVGETEVAATAALVGAQLTIGTVTQQTSTSVPVGDIISQTPAAGASVALGSPVNLVVSQGTGLPPDPSTVATPLNNTVATTIGSSTAFLYSGANPIQTAVSPDTIVPTRAAVLRGKVLDKTNAPLPGVTITVLNHPEFGQTLSRLDGMFDLAVNGGGKLILNYAQTGLLPAQRQVQVPWQDFALAPDVILIPPDTQVTTVDLTSQAPIQIARGSVITDTDGTRQATLLVPQGTQATMVMPNGSTQPLTTLSVRATEFTVGPNGPQTMAAELPPTSAYTYAVDLSADEASAAGAQVRFANPLPLYVENFLKFPVGIDVPFGSYDNALAAWLASENGRVVKILSITGGTADLDTTGSGSADNGVALGITTAERRQLASLYAPGQSLWRMTVNHLSFHDANCGYGTPPDAIAYNGSGPTGADKRDDACNSQGGSIIECQNQVLGETIRVTGTPFSLNYRSDRVPGRQDAHTLIVPLSGASIPKSLNEIVLEVIVGGQTFRQGFPPTAKLTTNLTTTFTWDGKDAYGRQTQGLQPALVRIGYVYNRVYTAAAIARAFGVGGGGVIDAFPREQIVLFTEYHTTLGSWDESPQGLGAWSLNVHHGYDVIGQVLYLGDGSRRSTNDKALRAKMTTVAGDGFNGFGGDGGPATAASLNLGPCFSGLAVGPDGTLYIADSVNSRVRRVGPDGLITTFAGTGTFGSGGDGGPAIKASLELPTGLALGPDGSLYIADSGASRVRRVGPDGTITAFAGTGTGGFRGDGGPATAAALNFPTGLAVGPDGGLYIADSDNFRVRRVGPDGLITTFAGTGIRGFSGDGGPATAASLSVHCSGLAVGPDGSLYIADSDNSRVRRVGPDGLIATFAGNGINGFSSGDGGPATTATIAIPQGLALGPDGSLYIADSINSLVRRVGPEGIISTVAGKAFAAGFGGDDGPPTAASLLVPAALALGPDGPLYIADDGNERVRKVASLPGFQLSDILIASEDGSEVYVFNGAGQHQRTLNALTGATRYTFAYDANGRLATATDGDGNVTTIQHDANGNPTAVVGPFGQRTAVTVDANGYLASVTDPALGAFQMGYTPDGLLTQFTDPNDHSSTIKYDPLGRLALDTDAAGGFTTLARTDADRSYTVSRSTALNRTTTYQIDNLTTGNERRANTFPDGTQAELLIGTDGSRKTTLADGSVINLLQGPDPRFSMLTPLAKSLSITTGGVTSTLTTQRTVILANPLNPLSLTTLNDTITINGRVSTHSFDATNKTFTNTSAAGRQGTAAIDAQGRVTSLQVSGLLAASLGYETRGRLASITQGTGSDERVVNFTYDANGYLQSITDPLNRTLTLQHDAAGRINQATLPDAREIVFGYDAKGNLTSVTPPGLPAHVFSYTPVDETLQYIPPLVTGTGSTTYSYNPVQQLMVVTRPDNRTVGLGYNSGGRLQTVTIARGTYTGAYDPVTGYLSSITAPDNEILTYGYNGALLAGTTWSGTVAGTVGQRYDNDFRLSSITVDGANAVSFIYDADSLLKQAGSLTLSRDPQKRGLVTGIALGNESEILSYNGFGEITGISATYNATPLLAEQYTRDKLGRVVEKLDTIGGVTTAYHYDLVGRLFQVDKNGTPTAIYTYDSNNNRTSVTRGSVMITAGPYDAQDRMAQYGGASYTYTANGELQSKTVSSQTTTYQHDELGNLQSIALAGGTLIEYIVDGQNRRVGKKVGGILVKGFLYQDRLNPLAELDGGNNVVSRFVYGSRSNLPDYMIRDGHTYRIIADQLGTPRLVVDVTTGVIAQQIDYDEFGQVLQDTNPGFQPFGFAGGLYDPDTKLVRFGTRDYDSETGRWTAKDHVGFAGGTEEPFSFFRPSTGQYLVRGGVNGTTGSNLYTYLGSDPVNYRDPLGLSPNGFISDWSLLSYLPGSGHATDAWETAFEAAVVKGTLLAYGGPALGGFLINASLFAEAGALTEVGLVVGSFFASGGLIPAAIAIGAGVTIAATYVDLVTQSENAPRNPPPYMGCPYPGY